MLKLVQIGPQEFDLAYDDPEKKDEDAALDTLLISTFYTDGEAPVNRVKDRYERRGWWAKKAGNGLWYVRRQPLSPEARKEAVFMIENALKKQKDALANIKVTDVTGRANSPTSVITEITGTYNGNTFVRKAPLL